MSSPKPAVFTSSVVSEKHSPLPSNITELPPAKLPSPVPAQAAATTTKEQTEVETDESRLEDLETELELDLENMKLDNIDTTVCYVKHRIRHSNNKNNN